MNGNSLVFNESQVGALMQCTVLVALTLSGVLVGLVSRHCLRRTDFRKMFSSNAKRGLSRLCCFKNRRCAQPPQRQASLQLGPRGREKQMTRSQCVLSTFLTLAV